MRSWKGVEIQEKSVVKDPYYWKSDEYIDALADYMDQIGITVNPDVIKALVDKDPTIKNLIKSFDGDKITLDTIVEPDSKGSDIQGSDEVSRMAKRALKKRS